MPPIKLPVGAGEWTPLRAEAGVETWRRELPTPDGSTVHVFYYAGSEHTPEIESSKDKAEVDAWFNREVARVRDKSV